MTTFAGPIRTSASPLEGERTGATLVLEHESLLRGVERRVAAVQALIAARTWPHSELATLVSFLRATLLRQVSDEEHLFYPHNATSAPFVELGAAHARLYELSHRLDDARDTHCPLPQLRGLVDDLLATLRRHLAEEQAVLAALADSDCEVPSAAALGERHRHWPTGRDDDPLVIHCDALPTTMATELCIERLLRLRAGEQAVVYSRDRARLHDVRSWLHDFDAARFALATASDRDGGTRLDVFCREPR